MKTKDAVALRCSYCQRNLPAACFRPRARKNDRGYSTVYREQPCLECAGRSRQPASKRPCPNCGAEFAPRPGRGGKQLHCSVRCQRAAHHKRTYQPRVRGPGRKRGTWRDHPTAECTLCHQVKPLSEYYRSGTARVCKECKKAERRRRYAAKSPEEKRAELDRVLQWQKEHPERRKETERIKKRQTKRARDKKMQFPNLVSLREWERVQSAFRHLCAYCDAPVEKPEMDHFVPLALGGQNRLDNVVPACRECNGKKSSTPPREWLQDEGRYQFICDMAASY